MACISFEWLNLPNTGYERYAMTKVWIIFIFKFQRKANFQQPINGIWKTTYNFTWSRWWRRSQCINACHRAWANPQHIRTPMIGPTFDSFVHRSTDEIFFWHIPWTQFHSAAKSDPNRGGCVMGTKLSAMSAHNWHYQLKKHNLARHYAFQFIHQRLKKNTHCCFAANLFALLSNVFRQHRRVHTHEQEQNRHRSALPSANECIDATPCQMERTQTIQQANIAAQPVSNHNRYYRTWIE